MSKQDQIRALREGRTKVPPSTAPLPAAEDGYLLAKVAALELRVAALEHAGDGRSDAGRKAYHREYMRKRRAAAKGK